METLAPTLDRPAMIDRYRANRRRTASIFAALPEAAYEHAAIPLRHPFVFYDGHIPAFSHTTLVVGGLGRPPLDPALQELFRRGIDPSDAEAARAHARSGWPSRERIAAFARACDDAVIAALRDGAIDDPSRPQTVHAEAAYNILEHEEMHHETLMYLVHRQRDPAARGPVPEPLDAAPPQREPVAVPAGIATLGAERGAIAFGWDNEFDRHEVAVGAFALDAYDVTNGEYLAFVRDGGDVPPFWVERDGAFRLLTAFGEIPLPATWPVYATHDGAEAFCRWSNARLMTEAEYHRAAFGTPSGAERPHPWGDAAPDPARHGNFGWRRFDPEPVGASPEGASAWGVHDLVGNGWEWTATPFAPFAGFAPMASYPLYSVEFFDGRHFVIKGASPVTSTGQVRRSLRNWFYADYPYLYATFRRAYG